MKDYILNLDRPRELRFGFKALRLIRQKYGNRSVDQLMNIHIDELPPVIWAGLKWEDSKLTEEQVENLLDDAIPKKYKIMEILEMTMMAFADHMGVPAPKKAPADDLKKTKKPITEVKTEEKEQPTETIPSMKKQKK